jgi:hypothetical protein
MQDSIMFHLLLPVIRDMVSCLGSQYGLKPTGRTSYLYCLSAVPISMTDISSGLHRRTSKALNREGRVHCRGSKYRITNSAGFPDSAPSSAINGGWQEPRKLPKSQTIEDDAGNYSP